MPIGHDTTQPAQTLKTLLKAVLNLGSQCTCKWEFRRQSFTRFNERPVELAFVFRQLARIYPRRVLDVGTGVTALPHLLRNCGCLVTATDKIKGYWPCGMVNRHYYIIDDDITESRLHGEFDFITCVSVLEHIENSDAAMNNIFRLLAPGGYLLLTFPYSEGKYIRNVYELPGSSYGQDFPFICQSYSRTDLDRWVRDNNGLIVEQEYWQFWEGAYWTLGRQIVPPRKTHTQGPHQLTCIVLQKMERYGCRRSH
jgi:SAM-dependent methyltransferase